MLKIMRKKNAFFSLIFHTRTISNKIIAKYAFITVKTIRFMNT